MIEILPEGLVPNAVHDVVERLAFGVGDAELGEWDGVEARVAGEPCPCVG